MIVPHTRRLRTTCAARPPFFTAFVFLSLALACSRPVRAVEPPPRAPLLRVDTGMHTASVQRIGVDAADRYLVTGSEDKTVRVWDLSTGRLLQTLRPPIAAGDEGKIYAVAITPDGKTVACGGWTGYAWDRSVSLYLFDRESGQLRRRITGLPNVPHHLVYSRNGEFLAAALGDKAGIRVYRAPDYALVASDTNYGAAAYGADFDGSGRLVTAALDGFVRLYNSPLAGARRGGSDKNFAPLAKKEAPGGGRPGSARFSPDGSLIAVGFVDTLNVDVLSGKDLTLRYSPSTSGATQENFSRICWSADGSALYAAGRPRGAESRIRRWSQQGRGDYVDLSAAKNTILDIVPLAKGGVAFGASDPSFGAFNARDERILLQNTRITDYSGARGVLSVSNEGALAQFASGARSSIRFSVSERLLEETAPPRRAAADAADAAAPSRVQPPRTSADGLDVRDWKDTNVPKLNGRRLPLLPLETARSLAITPDAQGFVLGTDWQLRCFDRSGAPRWSVPGPGIAWAVNVAGNGRVAVAAFGDGTLRWYRMRDGKELCALFPQNDKQRWALWTPRGYYDASPGGEDLVGWHINNGAERAADFFPASRFRSTYYRPDMVAKITATVDEAAALEVANKEAGRKPQPAPAIEEALPPLVAIRVPTDGAEVSAAQITFQYEVRSPSGAPVTEVRALVDGRPAGDARGLIEVPADPSHGVARTIRLTIPERDCEVSLIAVNRFAASVPATARLFWRGRAAPAPVPAPDVLKPKLYVLVVGVGQYADPGLTLRYPAKDARDFAAALQKQKGGLYRDLVVKVLTDAAATKEAILDGLEWIQKETTSKDVAMVFLSGHGANDPNGIYYFLPAGFQRERFKSTGVPFSDIKTTLQVLAGKVLFFVDTCHSGNVLGTARSRGGASVDIAGLVNELTSAENGAVVFAAATGRQSALEDPAWNNGAFTKALVEGIGGKADYLGKGKITVNMLDVYISERVKELTGGRQTPTTTKPETIADFPVAVRR